MTGNDFTHSNKISIMPFIVIGLVVGIAQALLTHYRVSGLPYLWLNSYGLLFLLAYPEARSWISLIFLTIISSFLCCVPIVWPNSNSADAFILVFINAYALTAFHIVTQKHGFKLPYDSLFFAVWDTFVKLIIGFLFTGICWLVLFLWGKLFDIIGIPFFSALFAKQWFGIVSTVFFASMGLYIASQNQKVVRNLRHILLLMCKFLLPVLAFIGILFMLSGLLNIFILNHKSNFDLPLPIFLSFALLAIIFINGVYQTGTGEPYPRVLAMIVNIFIIILPAFIFIALYTLFFDAWAYQQYPPLKHDVAIASRGLNDTNFSTLISSLILLAYAICYAIIALLRQTPWLKSLAKTNIILAISLIAITLSLNNYWFSHAKINPGRIKFALKSSPAQLQNEVQKRYQNLNARLKKEGFSFSRATSAALILGYNRDGAINLCRSTINAQEYSGVVNKNRCQLSDGKNIQNQKVFTVLSGSADKIFWKNWLTDYDINLNQNESPLPIGFNKNAILFICRTIYNNQIYVGIISDKENQCHIIVNDRFEATSEFYQFLYFK